MLRMSKLTDYGTVVMTYIAREPERVHNASEIAANVHLALPTVSKILKLLAREELLVSYRGTKGGYSLARPPQQISVAQILDAMEGPIGLTQCSSMPGVCVQEPSCSIRPNWQMISGAVRAALESVTLTDMTHPLVHHIDATGIHFTPSVRAS